MYIPYDYHSIVTNPANVKSVSFSKVHVGTYTTTMNRSLVHSACMTKIRWVNSIDLPKFGGDGKFICVHCWCSGTQQGRMHCTLTGKKRTNIHDAELDVTTNDFDMNLNQYIASENCQNDLSHLKQSYMNMEKRYKK